MGTMTFLLPAGLKPDALRELQRACVAGGPDNMPWPTQVRLTPTHLSVRRTVDESGCLVVPWEVGGGSCFMGTSATLMEREAPYALQLELARGKVNQLRCQAWDWRASGLQMPSTLEEQIRQASHDFGHALVQPDAGQTGYHAQAALNLAYQAADQLVHLYTDQVFQIRRQRYPRIETSLGCRLGSAVPDEKVARDLVAVFDTAYLPLSWKAVEPAEGTYRWDEADALLDWATANGRAVTAGPLVDFSAVHLPDWLWLWERDLGALAKFMETYVATVVQRYRQRIRTWQLTAASNWSTVLALGEDELLWLTVRLAEVARQIDPELRLVVGIAQPWGEYMAQEDRTHSPFVFADTLIRSGLNLAAIDLELVMGLTPRASYCRDLLEVSRLLDLYAILGVPLRVTLAYPSSAAVDPRADPELKVGAGHWRGGFTPEAQADWASAVAPLAACKPYVQAVHWAHFSDAEPHQFPHAGLVDALGRPKPVLQRLQQLRDEQLR